MNKKNIDYLKSLADINNGFDYELILQLFQKEIPDLDIREHTSAYKIDYITKNEYISCRIANHLPSLENYMRMNPGMMSIRPYGHICLMFFGSDDAKKLRSSEKGNYVMGRKRTEYKLKITDKAFKFYKEKSKITIPYYIYHIITNLVEKDDIIKLSDEIQVWSLSDGNESFIFPKNITQNIYCKEHIDKNFPNSIIQCDMVIKNIGINESARMVSGKTPMLSFDMGRVTLVSSTGEEITLQGTLEIKECSSFDFLMLCEFNKNTKQ